MNDYQQVPSLALSALENLRTRLLDLSVRNRLLSYRHGRTGNLRIVDELPDHLYELLLSEQELRFLPVPEPTREQLLEAAYIQIDKETGQEEQSKKPPSAEEWARWLSIQTSYELPEPCGSSETPQKHRDKAIQVLLFPYELEARLRDLRSKAETAIEETGANILYLSLGFLEWFESLESDTPRLAPLALIPVRLAKGRLNRQTGTYEYTIAYSGEDLLPNLSLHEKLRLDFGLALPEFDDNIKPEQYFTAVRELITPNQPRWSVRRYATVALLNFSKLLMYLDLDPNRWPVHKSITTHPIIKSFFERGQASNSDGNGFVDEYNIDELPEIHERYPLIDDADSSQHSALVDAIKGENLVIEGPPGTGKSQTITNLIAAALAQGKRVLFVAEKLAALEVVKRRLDNAGLGEFCLELHSHKTQKRRLLDDIESRLQKSYRQPVDIDADITRFEELKEKLRQHAEQINSLWKATGKSIHAILAAATRYRQQLHVDPAVIHPADINGETFDAGVQRQSRDLVRSFGQVYTAIAGQFIASDDLSSHPWYGIDNPDLHFFDAHRICEALAAWQEALRKLNVWRCETQPLFSQNGEVELPEALAELQQVAEDLQRLSHVYGDERFDALPWLRGENLKAYRTYLALFRGIQELYQRLTESVTPALLQNLSLLDHLKASSEGLRALGISRETNLGTVARLFHKINSLERPLQEIDRTAAELTPRLGPAAQNAIAVHEQGLKELRQLVELAVALETSLWKIRHKRFDDEELDEALPRLHARITALREQRASLSSTFQVDRLPPIAELAEIQARLANRGLLRWLKGDWRAARKRLLALSAQPRRGLKTLLPVLDELVSFAKGKEALDGNQRLHRLLGDHFQGLETAIDDLQKIRSWYQWVRQCYGVGFGPKVGLGQALLDMPIEVATGVRSLADQGFLQQINAVLEELDRLKAALPRAEGLQQGNVLLLGEQGILQTLKADITRSLTPCQEYLVEPDLSLGMMEGLLSDLIRLRDLMNEWKASDVDAQWVGGALGLTIGLGHDNATALAAAEHTESFASLLDSEIKISALKEEIYSRPERQRLEELAACGRQLGKVWSEHCTTLQQFSDLTVLDFAAWIRKSGDQLGRLIARNDHALRNPEWLANWLEYVRVKRNVVESGFHRLVQAVEQGLFVPGDVEAGYNLAVYDLLSREILRELPPLAQFSGNVQEVIQKQFCEYDEKLKQLQRERIARRIAQNRVPGGNSGGRVSNYTELALLRKECSKKKRHVPIRQLVRRAGNALAALKPCFMMGPMSVAQYLAPGELEFDVVVMDEASQVKPEDALGAVARGRQLVVVGDPKQLPPTSFFEKLIDDNEDDPTALEESESILDATVPLFKARRLRWHYRSRHESLIAFSNQFFYDGQLVLFPSPHNDGDEYGIKFTRAHRGRFVNRRNIEEARIIAEAVRGHLLERSEESLGIVAMSAEQRDEIERAVETLAKEDGALRSMLERETGKIEPLFIKNLENVQGDERDIMFISMTYGPQDVGGPVMQRFGPINSEVGWRRLNVLFTRARKRMHVFSSMGSEDIVLSASSKRGVRALKDFLAYAETGILHHAAHPTNRQPDSDFEIAVAEALHNVGFECVPQIGVAGFFIDIAVRDPGNPGRFLMGIECDGASYHSAKSVRDRDRLRQTILERLGWRMRRIWSTDWYKNPQAQLQPIIRELNTLKTEKPVVLISASEAQVIDAIVTKIEKEEEQSLGNVSGVTLRERLLRFDQEIIRAACPRTPENKRLLRPVLLEALLEYRPASKGEFLERIPPYLRQATSAEEGTYLAQVLAIIDQASEEMVGIQQ